MTVRYYHFYTIPTKPNEQARRRNIEAVRSASESREIRKFWNGIGHPTAVYASQKQTSPDFLPFGETLWQ
jgi:hypothetical protein